MRILGIDTSSGMLSIAISEDNRILKEESYDAERRHLDLLISKIDSLLRKMGMRLQDIGGFIVGLGPGSFTGLRIGITTIKGFGLALRRPCVGIPSIDALAMNAPLDGIIIPIIDAKRSLVYAAIYKKRGGRIDRLSRYFLISIDKLLKRIDDKAIFLGDGLALYRDTIRILHKKSLFLDERFWYPKADGLIRLGYKRLRRYKGIGLSGLEPLYIYSRYCQIRMDRL